MRKWLVDKLFSLALRIDEVETTILARLWVDSDNFNRMVDALIKDMTESIEKRTPKLGRPKGRKDRVGLQNQTAPKKRGRPLGSKNKPKGVNDGAIG